MMLGFAGPVVAGLKGLCGRETGWQVPDDDQAVSAAGYESGGVVAETNRVDSQIMSTKKS